MLEQAPPESILYVPAGVDSELPFVPKLVDFGLAKVADAVGSQTRSGVTIGSFGYMSPEQAEGRTSDIGPATDVHALGLVLYECLTGSAPYWRFRGGLFAPNRERRATSSPTPSSADSKRLGSHLFEMSGKSPRSTIRIG